MTFENIVAKGEIAHDDQFPLLPQCFQIYLMIKLSFTEIFHIFSIILFKLVCCRIVVCGKGLRKGNLLSTGSSVNSDDAGCHFQVCEFEPLLGLYSF